jgi:hypothetical protein
MPAAYLSDLDHTLLDGEARLSARSRCGLLRLLAEGVAFSVASARSAWTIRTMFEGVPLALPVIEFGGAHISDPISGEHYVTHALPAAAVARALDVACETGVDPFVSSHDGRADRLSHRPAGNDGQAWYVEDRRRARDPRVRCVDDLASVVDEDVVCMTFVGRRELLDRVASSLGGFDDVRVRRFDNGYSPGWHWVTVQSPPVSIIRWARVSRRWTASSFSTTSWCPGSGSSSSAIPN